MSDPGLHAEVVVRRGTGFTVDLSLDIPPGITVALLGPNGAGKSTVVDVVAGVIPIDRGRVTLGGRTLDDPEAGVFIQPEGRHVGTVFQDAALFPHMTVVENIAFGPRSRGMPRREARAVASEWLLRVGLDGLGEMKPGDLSGGQAQRAALARALVIEPDALLLDEPLSAIDVSSRTGLRRVLSQHLDAFAGPRLLITHDPSEAFLLADEIHVIEGGAVTQRGSADDIRLRPQTSYAADLAGVNLFAGEADRGVVMVGGHPLHTADSGVSGAALVTIHPRAVAVHRDRPAGSPRNVWRTTVDLVERLGNRVRVRVSDPLPLTAEVTAGSADTLELEAGVGVWLSIKATEVIARPD